MRAQRRAGRRVERAEARAPARHALPYVPVKRRYTARELRAIERTVQPRLQQYLRGRGALGARRLAAIKAGRGDPYGAALRELRLGGDPSTLSALAAVGLAHGQRRESADARTFRQVARYEGAQRGEHPAKTERLLRGVPRGVQAQAGAQWMAQFPHGTARPGPKRSLLSRAGADLGGVGRVLTQGVHPVAGMSWANVPGISDVLSIGANAIPSLYATGAAAVEAAQGRPERAHALWKEFKKTDPFALAAQGKFGKASEALLRHPLLAGLEVSGAEGAVGRGLGRVSGRRFVPRPPRVLPGTSIEEIRTYSPDLFHQWLQMRGDKRNAARSDELRREAAQAYAEGKPGVARTKHAEANEVDPFTINVGPPVRGWRSFVGRGGATRRVDETFAVNEEVRRQNRGAVVEVVHDATRGEKPGRLRRRPGLQGQGALSLVAQRIISPTREDLRAYASELEHQSTHGDLNAAQLHANQALRDQIDGVLKNKKVSMSALEDASGRYAELTLGLEREVGRREILPREQMERARLTPAMVRLHGARHVKIERRYPAAAGGSDLAFLEDAGNAVRDAQSELHNARRAHEGARATLRAEDTPRNREHVDSLGQRVGERRDAVHAAQTELDRLRRETFTAGTGRSETYEGLAVPTGRVSDEALAAAERRYYESREAALRSQDPRARHTPDERRAILADAGEAEMAWRGVQAEAFRPVSTVEMRSMLRESGIDPDKIAFLTQAPNRRGGRNFWRSFFQQRAEHHETRTGAGTLKGTFDVHPDTLVEQAARLQGLIDADEGWRGFLREFAVHDPDRPNRPIELATFGDAERVREQVEAVLGRKLKAVRMVPWRGRDAQLRALLDGIDAEGVDVGRSAADLEQAQTIREAIGSALKGEDGEGPWTLVDEAVADRGFQHQQTLGGGGGTRLWQLFNSAFRRTVLSLSTKWLAGNVVEAGLRNTLAGAGLKSWLTGRRLMDGVREFANDERAFNEFVGRTARGGHYSMAERQHVVRTAEQFENSPYLAPFARAAGAFWRSPGPRNLAHAWQLWTRLVFDGVNGSLERQFQIALVGKYARTRLMDESGIRVSEKAIEQAARGLTNTNEQVAMGRFVDRAYGRYGKFGPGQRKVIVLATPFIPWYWNAVRFLFDVLPRDHPVLVGVLAGAHHASEEWRKEHKLDLFMEGAAPGWLQGSLPLKGEGKLRISRYTPFAAFGSPLETMADQVFPQFSSILAAARGQDWRGQPLKGPDGKPLPEPDRFQAMLGALFESTVPLFSQASRVFVQHHGFRREFDPFYPVKPKQTSGGASRAPSGPTYSARPKAATGAVPGVTYSARPRKP